MARFFALSTLALAVSPAAAFFLMPCWPIMTERLDPVVAPGKISSHVHQIAGGDGFAPLMDYNTTQAASCTTCFVRGDKSNYWIPALYYQYENGSFERVPQVGSASMYYFNEPTRLGPGEKMESFPEGLRMLAGSADKRTPGTDAASLAMNYKCLNYAGVPTDSKTFPTGNCPNGVRAEVTFPSCWNGKDLDSADHKSHMAYPTGTFESGACPAGYPHHLVTLKVEYIFDTNRFKDMWYGNSQPFIWASGDNTGYGLHGDYMMGWEDGLLESAVEQCFDIYGVLANCAPFNGRLPATKDTFANPGTCTLQPEVLEDVGGTLAALPGCVAAGNAAKPAGCVSNAKMKNAWAAPAAAVAPSSSSASTPPASQTTTLTLVRSSSSAAAFNANVASSSSSLSSSPTPSPSPSPPSSSSTGSVYLVTVTSIITETDYVTATQAGTFTFTSTTTAAAQTVSLLQEGADGKVNWHAVRREFTAHRHQHRHAPLHRKGKRGQERPREGS